MRPWVKIQYPQCNGWCTYPKMVPLALTHTRVCVPHLSLPNICPKRQNGFVQIFGPQKGVFLFGFPVNLPKHVPIHETPNVWVRNPVVTLRFRGQTAPRTARLGRIQQEVVVPAEGLRVLQRRPVPTHRPQHEVPAGPQLRGRVREGLRAHGKDLIRISVGISSRGCPPSTCEAGRPMKCTALDEDPLSINFAGKGLRAPGQGGLGNTSNHTAHYVPGCGCVRYFPFWCWSNIRCRCADLDASATSILGQVLRAFLFQRVRAPLEAPALTSPEHRQRFGAGWIPNCSLTRLTCLPKEGDGGEDQLRVLQAKETRPCCACQNH